MTSSTPQSYRIVSFLLTLIRNFRVWNLPSNQQCESIFSTFRRKEKENYSFQVLQTRAMCVQNKVVDWLQEHPNRSEIISDALRLVFNPFSNFNSELIHLKLYKKKDWKSPFAQIGENKNSKFKTASCTYFKIKIIFEIYRRFWFNNIKFELLRCFSSNRSFWTHFRFMPHQKFYPKLFLTSALNAHFNLSANIFNDFKAYRRDCVHLMGFITVYRRFTNFKW